METYTRECEMRNNSVKRSHQTAGRKRAKLGAKAGRTNQIGQKRREAAETRNAKVKSRVKKFATSRLRLKRKGRDEDRETWQKLGRRSVSGGRGFVLINRGKLDSNYSKAILTTN